MTSEMGFDEGVEAHQEGEKKHEQCPEMWKCSCGLPKSRGYQFHMQVWAPDPVQDSPLSSRPVHGIWNRELANLLNPKIELVQKRNNFLI